MEKEINIYDEVAELLGATYEGAKNVFTIYVPNADRDGKVIENHSMWVERIANTLADICSGCSYYPVNGIWLGKPEKTMLIYSSILDPKKFISSIDEIRTLLHEFGTQTNQHTVLYVFGNAFYQIKF